MPLAVFLAAAAFTAFATFMNLARVAALAGAAQPADEKWGSWQMWQLGSGLVGLAVVPQVGGGEGRRTDRGPEDSAETIANSEGRKRKGCCNEGNRAVGVHGGGPRPGVVAVVLCRCCGNHRWRSYPIDVPCCHVRGAQVLYNTVSPAASTLLPFICTLGLLGAVLGLRVSQTHTAYSAALKCMPYT